ALPLSLCPDRSYEAVLQAISSGFRACDGGCGQFGILMTVDGLYFVWGHSRIWVRKPHAVVSKAAVQHFGVNHGVVLPPSSFTAEVGSSLCVCAAKRLGVVSALPPLGCTGSSCLVVGSDFEAGCVVFAFCRAAFAAASISAFTSASVLRNSTCECT